MRFFEFRGRIWKAAPAENATLALVQPQLGNMPWIGLQLALLDTLHNIHQRRIRPAGDADLLALAHDQPVQKLDLGATALLHVLAHRGALAGRGAAGIFETLGVAYLLRCRVAFARAGDGLGRQVQDFLKLIALGLGDADRFGAEPGREAADRHHSSACRRRPIRCRRKARSAWRWRRALTSARPTDCW